MSAPTPAPPAFLTALSAFGWVWVGLLSLDVVSSVVRAALGALRADGGGVDAALLTHQVGEALIVALPTLFLLGVMADFARFFGRVGVGDVFTERNLRTLRSGGEGLLAAAVASAVGVPTLLGWIGSAPNRGLGLELNDLTLGVAAMGFAVAGLGWVFQDALRIKHENDEIV